MPYESLRNAILKTMSLSSAQFYNSHVMFFKCTKIREEISPGNNLE